MIYFVLGMIAGMIILLIYIKYEKMKWKNTFKHKNTIFQLVERSKDIIYYYELKPAYKHRYTSPSVENLLGKGTLDALENNPDTPFDIIHPDDYEIMYKKITGDIDYNKGIIQRLRDTEGNYKCFEEHTTPIYENGELIAVQGIMRNIDEKIKLEQDLQYRITHDVLTDVYNRAFFERTMEKYDKDFDTAVAIILCDLDELKHLNDNYGHKRGDLLIKESAQLLNQYFLNNAIVSRVGGDEFAIILVNTEQDQVESLCKKLVEEISKYNVSSDDIEIKMSIGYAYSKHSLGEMERLFTDADQQMYQNKRAKKQLS